MTQTEKYNAYLEKKEKKFGITLKKATPLTEIDFPVFIENIIKIIKAELKK